MRWCLVAPKYPSHWKAMDENGWKAWLGSPALYLDGQFAGPSRTAKPGMQGHSGGAFGWISDALPQSDSVHTGRLNMVEQSARAYSLHFFLCSFLQGQPRCPCNLERDLGCQCLAACHLSKQDATLTTVSTKTRTPRVCFWGCVRNTATPTTAY